MAHELEQDNATFRLDKDNPTHEDAEAIILKDTMNMADWQTLGISDLEPFRDIVRLQRQYKDQSTDADSFDWVLDDIGTLQFEIILLLRQLTGKKNIKVTFTPDGWFVKQLEKEVTEDMTPLGNPFPRVKAMTPPEVFKLIMVKNPRDRNKILEWIRRRVLPYHGPEGDRRVFVKPTSWRHITEEAKENAAAAAMNGLGFSKFILFDGSWVYLWLVARARINLTDERRKELLDLANEMELGPQASAS